MAGNLHTTIDYLTVVFRRLFVVDLWKTFPLSQLAELDDSVDNKDAFRSRIATLVALFDKVNKKAFDKSVGQISDGSRLSLIAFLKFELPSYHLQVESVFHTVSSLASLRNQLLHGSDKSHTEAYQYFDIREPIVDYSQAWEKIRDRFEVFLSELITLMSNKNTVPLKQQELESKSIEMAFLYTLQRHAFQLKEYPLSRMLLREVAVKGDVTDIDLATSVGHPVKLIRELLLPFTASFLRVSYHTDSTTLISMDMFREEIKNIDVYLEEMK